MQCAAAADSASAHRRPTWRHRPRGAGVHDGIGAVVKRTLRLAEAHGHRLHTSKAAADYLKETLRSEECMQQSFSVYSINRFKVFFVPRGEVVRETTHLTGVKDTRQLYQFVGVPMAEQGRSRRLKEQGAQAQHGAAAQKPGKKAAPHLKHQLMVRVASCYCRRCSVGQHQDCVVASHDGVRGLVGQPEAAFLKEVLPAVAAAAGGGGSAGGTTATRKRKAPSQPSATLPDTAPMY
jgi:hypothetical protein